MFEHFGWRQQHQPTLMVTTTKRTKKYKNGARNSIRKQRASAFITYINTKRLEMRINTMTRHKFWLDFLCAIAVFLKHNKFIHSYTHSILCIFCCYCSLINIYAAYFVQNSNFPNQNPYDYECYNGNFCYSLVNICDRLKFRTNNIQLLLFAFFSV